MSKARLWAETYASIRTAQPAAFTVDNPPRGSLRAHVTEQGECWVSMDGALFAVVTPKAMLALAHWTIDTFADN